jgi:Tfp pilus assembly protein PilN
VNNRLNVATKPFSNRALPWLVTVIMVMFSFVVLTFEMGSTNQANSKAVAVQKEIASLNQQEQDILKRAEEVKNSLTREQLQSLKSAHELVDRKSFSWSRLFADLEGVLPDDVRVSRIAVRQVHTIGGRTVADLEFAVVAKSPTIVTDMIAEMDKQGVFRAELSTQTLQKGRGETGSEYELKIQYTPSQSFASQPEQPARAAVANPGAELVGGKR